MRSIQFSVGVVGGLCPDLISHQRCRACARALLPRRLHVEDSVVLNESDEVVQKEDQVHKVHIHEDKVKNRSAGRNQLTLKIQL